jgi:hypothetical protein
VSERVVYLELESGSTLTLTKASNGAGRGIRFELYLQIAGHGEALVRLTAEEMLHVSESLAAQFQRGDS